MKPSDREQAQHERALQAWELFVLDAAEPRVLAALRRVLRAKRVEVPGLAARLPGVVRRGARLDLEPLEAALRAAGVRCTLRRTAADPGAPAPGGSGP